MSLRLYNTLSGRVEPVEPLVPGHLGLYVCGVTPYAESHVGHAMSLIVYDTLVRYLRWPGNSFGGLDVTYVSNYTDVEDKLIARGAELGVDPLQLANQNIVQWEDEQGALGLLLPDERPRVTSHIPEIIALTERLVANRYAYATPAGDVYFRVRNDDDYGKLSHRHLDDLRAGTRFDPDEGKEFPLDFALWKASKPGEPSWPSPWGHGRPGWHIECSAMAQRYLGDTFDIHGGGLDLVFPHHENEIAQSESATGKPFARLWMHNGLVLRHGEKMSKSVGNVVSVHEALERWSPDALRLFVLNSSYRSPNNLTDEAMEAATRAVRRLTSALRPVAMRNPRGGSITGPDDYRRAFVEAMETDLNTSQALAVLFAVAREVNKGRAAGIDEVELRALLDELTKDVLGLRLAQTSEVHLSDVIEIAQAFGAETHGSSSQVVDAILAARNAARASRQYDLGDSIRDALAQLGIEVRDTPTGSEWDFWAAEGGPRITQRVR